MAAVQVDAEEEVISFELLPDFEMVGEEINVDNLTQEQQEHLYRIMDTINASSLQEKDADFQAFEEEETKAFQFVRKTEAEIDDVAASTHRDSTKWQTKWAVKVFKGNYQTLSVNFF